MEQSMHLYKTYIQNANLIQKDYQETGVRWCLDNELRTSPPHNTRGGFLADEMGLGKTITMIATIYANPLKNTLIVLPPILIEQWTNHIFNTTGIMPLIYHGPNKRNITIEELHFNKIVIATYAGITITKKQLHNNISTLLHKKHWDRLIFDEAHHLRNKNTSLAHSAKLIPAQIRWLVTGTPIQNAKKDFYTLCSIIGLPASYYTNNLNLKHLAQHFILKRTKAMLGIKITDIHLHYNTIHWKSMKEHQFVTELHSSLNFTQLQTKNDHLYVNHLIEKYGNRTANLILMLRSKQACILPALLHKSITQLPHNSQLNYTNSINYTSKIDTVVQTILNNNNHNGKLIFCTYKDEIDIIATKLTNANLNIAVYDGRTSKHDKNLLLSSKYDALILQIQTASEGLNLQHNYNEIYFVSPHWNPTVEQQAIARCHRIGQTKDVHVYRFVMDNLDDNNICIEKYTNNIQVIKNTIAQEILP